MKVLPFLCSLASSMAPGLGSPWLRVVEGELQWQESQTTRALELIPDLFPCTRWMEGIGLLTHGCLHAVAMHAGMYGE